MVTDNKDFEKVNEQGAKHFQQYAETHLTRARAGNKYICPICNSGGNGKNSTSAFELYFDTATFHCFSSNCTHPNGGFVDLVGACNGLDPDTQRHECLELAAQEIGYVLSDWSKNQPAPAPKVDPAKQEQERKERERIERNREHKSTKIKEWQANLSNPAINAPALEYLKQRGYSLEQAQMLKMGYDPTTQNEINSPCIVTPYAGTNYYYVLRDITGNAQNKCGKPKKKQVGAEPIFNAQCLDTAPCVLVVEGSFDMLAIKTLNIPEINVIPVITSNADRLARLLEQRKKQGKQNPPMLLMLDNDKSGRKGQAKLADALAELDIPSHPVNLAGLTGKDADEMRINDADALKDAVTTAREYLLANLDKCLADAKLQALFNLKGIKDTSQTINELISGKGLPPAIKTHIQWLDDKLNGGLHTGLTVLCAGSSVGKTTLMLQIADNIARDGKPVLFVSIEQSKRELLAKSLSRISLQNEKAKQQKNEILKTIPKGAITSNALLFNEQKTTQAITRTLKETASEYTNKIKPYMYICEPPEEMNANDIKQIAHTMADALKEPPIIFIDYLQLLDPINERDTDRKIVDNNIKVLRKLAGELDTPVFCISSLNRESYWRGISLDSCKESGAIEYSADVFIGLQPFNLAKKIKAIRDMYPKNKPTSETCARSVYDDYKEQEVCFATLIISKNRNGKTSKTDKTKLKFYAEYACFESVNLEELEEPTGRP